MRFHPSDVLPELRKSANPAERKNHDFLVRAKLMARDPAGERDWAERYTNAFRDLYAKDDTFRERVNSELTEDNLRCIQEHLDAFVG